MLYPGLDEEDRKRAAAYSAHFRNPAYRQFLEHGGHLSPEIETSLNEDDQLARDHKTRWKAGLAVGNLTKVLFGLMQGCPELASWNHAIDVVSRANASNKLPASPSYLWDAKAQFLTVAHLWGAWCVREGNFVSQPGISYDLATDFQYFLYEAELLRHFGRTYHQDRDKAEPFLPDEAWHVPPEWEGPKYKTEWPERPGDRLHYILPAEMIGHLRPGGRPKRSLTLRKN